MMLLIRHIGILSAILFMLWGCGNATGSQGSSPMRGLIASFSDPDWLQSVKTIQQVTDQTSGDAVQVSGVVQQHIPLLEQWLYQIEDASGSLWILTSTPPPAVGNPVTLKAQIEYESILMGGTDIGEYYAFEIERLTATDSSPK